MTTPGYAPTSSGSAKNSFLPSSKLTSRSMIARRSVLSSMSELFTSFISSAGVSSLSTRNQIPPTTRMSTIMMMGTLLIEVCSSIVIHPISDATLAIVYERTLLLSYSLCLSTTYSLLSPPPPAGGLFPVLPLRAAPIHVGKVVLAQTNTLRGNLQILIFGHHLKSSLNRKFVGRDKINCFVGAGGSHVGELFSLSRVNCHLFAL